MTRNIAQDNANRTLFLDTACHDLKQSLYAVSYSMEALATTQINEKQKPIIKSLHNSINAMERMLTALLDTSRLESGTIQPNNQHFNLENILSGVRAEGMVLSRQKSLDFQCNETECIACTDPVLLETIMRNLVANAFRYTQEGKVWIICTNLDDGTLAIEVGDTGIGIHADNHEKIFNENYQVDNPGKDKSKGLGLGLTIVQKLAKILNLEIKLNSKKAQGTQFIVTVLQGQLRTKPTTKPQPPAT